MVRLHRALARPFRYPVRWLAFLAGGVPAVLVFPGPGLSYLAWFALVPGMVLFARAATTRQAIARGWWFGAGYLIAILQWMTPQIGPCVVLIGAIFGCLYSPFAVAVSRLLKPPVSMPRALIALFVVPSCWPGRSAPPRLPRLAPASRPPTAPSPPSAAPRATGARWRWPASPRSPPPP